MSQKIILTEKQKEFFKEEGYLLIEKVVEDRDLQDVIDELNNEIGKRAKELFDNGELSDLY